MATVDDKSAKPRGWLLWLHRIGYIATALIVAELIAIAYFATRARLEERQIRSAQIEDTRTHEGPLQANSDRLVRGSAVYLLGQMQPLSSLHGDGFRFAAMPSFNRTHFAVVVLMPRSDAAEAEGVLAQFDSQYRYALISKRPFRMPASAYRSLVARIDKLSDGWPGDSGFWLDGTAAAFERVRGQRVTSGIGNNPHYEQMANLVWTYVRQFAPGDDLPRKGDWQPTG